ncbi:MAG: TIGR00730 family Rossman fold protein [Deltaproteobacteria bacterium]
MKEFVTGCEKADQMIAELSAMCAPNNIEPYLHDILTAAMKLGLESSDKGDLKLVNNALKELRYSFKIFTPYRNIKKAVIFGSARSKNTSPEYLMAEEFSRKIVEKGYMVITGGGPGIMEAGNKGAPHKDFALNIRLPFEQKPNPYINEKEKIINFKYFFTRKLLFIKESNATALFPGGFGTLDEGFEMLTLVQTGKSAPRPVVLMDPEGSSYWSDWKRFVDKNLVDAGYINKEDLDLFTITKNVDEAVRQVTDFYRVYHSIRYVRDLTVFRLNRPVSEATLKRLNHDFADILTSGEMTLSGHLPEEVERGEFLDLPRLVMKFNRHNYGRLLELIRELNKD